MPRSISPIRRPFIRRVKKDIPITRPWPNSRITVNKRQQFETNVWGTIKLTNELLPYFRKQKHGKIITLGSIVGLISLPSAAYYAASKHALEGYFKALRFELNQFNIQVSMVEPMGFKT